MKKKTTEEFKFEALSVHGDRYDYSKSQYTGATKHLTVTCIEHGDFMITPALHLRGTGCKKCFIKTLYSSKDEFILKAYEVHKMKYDYGKVKYIHSKKKVIIICPEHGDFSQSPNSHLKGSGCPTCKKITLHNKMTSNDENFILKANIVHNNKYSYDNVVYISNKIPVIIKCKLHGDFKQRPDSHLNGKGCSKCKSSKAIKDITKFLSAKGFVVVLEQRFYECKNKRPLPFDIYIKELNLCIEYDGRHHFEAIECWGGIDAFSICQQNDSIKNQYCKEKNINLLRIKYTEDYIETIKRYFYETFGVNLKD